MLRESLRRVGVGQRRVGDEAVCRSGTARAPGASAKRWSIVARPDPGRVFCRVGLTGSKAALDAVDVGLEVDQIGVGVALLLTGDLRRSRPRPSSSSAPLAIWAACSRRSSRWSSLVTSVPAASGDRRHSARCSRVSTEPCSMLWKPLHCRPARRLRGRRSRGRGRRTTRRPARSARRAPGRSGRAPSPWRRRRPSPRRRTGSSSRPSSSDLRST